LFLRILMIETNKYGHTYDEIVRNIRGKKIDVVEKTVSMDIHMLWQHIKRFDFVCLSHLRDAIHEINLISEDIENDL